MSIYIYSCIHTYLSIDLSIHLCISTKKMYRPTCTDACNPEAFGGTSVSPLPSDLLKVRWTCRRERMSLNWMLWMTYRHRRRNTSCSSVQLVVPETRFHLDTTEALHAHVAVARLSNKASKARQRSGKSESIADAKRRRWLQIQTAYDTILGP